ncbi:glycosyltransferase [Cellulosilyticum sp. ST5]|uniref:glycosyltransferase family 2 protein n=1 Tax=Cellulosilyticum sp. ST5 TaxID=3055805 RepID=UPI0039777FBD
MELEGLKEVLTGVVLIYTFCSVGIAGLFTIMAYYHFKRYRHYKAFKQALVVEKGENIPVSIIVPAYNEAITITSTIRSLLASTYQQYEIIIVDDGSTDDTLRVLVEAFQMKKIFKPTLKAIETQPVIEVYGSEQEGVNLILIHKENGGKADCLNAGINYAQYDIFVGIDADCILQKDALKELIVPFIENKQTLAVGGNIKIANDVTFKEGEIVAKQKPKNLLVGFQMLEYKRAFLTSRIGWDFMNMNLIISGAFGAFQKSAVIEVGGYKTKTIGEDMELVMRLHSHFLKENRPYVIKQVADATCYTQAPDTIRGLGTQRKRWQKGLIQSLFSHPQLFLSWCWFGAKLYYILFELISPLIEIFGIVLLVVLSLLDLVNVIYVLKLYVFLLVANAFVSIAALLLEVYAFKEKNNEKVIGRLILLSLIETMGYRQILSFYRLLGFLGHRKNGHKWGEIKRKAIKEL